MKESRCWQAKQRPKLEQLLQNQTLELKAIDDGRHSSFIYFLLSAVHIIIIVVKICRYNQLGRVGYAVIKTDKLNFSEFNVYKTSLQRSLEQSVLIQFSLSFISVNLRE